MPTNQNAYNSRVTDEALEKRFRDTFRSQGGAELVDDLYASGVIVPVVDFTAAAEGSQLGQNLQTAWDKSTNLEVARNSQATLTNTAGFYQVDVIAVFESGTSFNADFGNIHINDGISNTNIWQVARTTGGTGEAIISSNDKFVVFIDSGDSLVVDSNDTACTLIAWTRQIADVSGNLVNPSGFTSS